MRSASFQIGATVEISRGNAPQKGQIGIITGLRVPGEWWVQMEEWDSKMSWRESSMMVVESTDSMIRRLLGDDYL